jgi:glycerol-3-phosphate acyltransferase PlsY
MQKVFLFLICFLIGSIPTAYIVGKINNIDIRKYGSGNVGSTNVYRVIGKKWGIFTFIIDFLKGFIPTYLVIKNNYDPYTVIIGGIFTICGHVFTPFLNFKGGKGVATSTGVFMAITPKTLLISLLVFLVVVIISRIVSLATLIATTVFFTASILSKISIEFKYMITIVSLIIYTTHIPNIKRLLRGEELKI